MPRLIKQKPIKKICHKVNCFNWSFQIKHTRSYWFDFRHFEPTNSAKSGPCNVFIFLRPTELGDNAHEIHKSCFLSYACKFTPIQSWSESLDTASAIIQWNIRDDFRIHSYARTVCVRILVGTSTWTKLHELNICSIHILPSGWSI